MSAKLALTTVAIVYCLAALPAAGQDATLPSSAPAPANLAYIEGGVDLVHDGVTDRATAGSMLLDGDVVRTTDGRAEIVFGDGSLLHLDVQSAVELLSPLRLRLTSGRVVLRISAAATSPYAIDTPAATARLNPRGEYGVTADGRLERLELTVARGVGQLETGGVSTVVRAGEMATIAGPGARAVVQQFNSARWDAFARWANERTNGFSAAYSARDLPVELRPYAPMLDGYGRWDQMAPYGNVWFPSVGADWRPYYAGSWNLTRYGWTWIGNDPWAWPTHHFGRWGYTGASWYWIPNRVWGPAWVSWNFVPGFVSWCPLGWDGRAALGFYGRPGDHPAYWPNDDRWRGWTVVPRDGFGARRPVRTHAVDPRRLPEPVRRAFSGAVPPATRTDYAVPRGSVVAPAPSYITPDIDRAVPRDLTYARRPGNVRAPRTEYSTETPREWLPPEPIAIPREYYAVPVRPGGVRSPSATPPPQVFVPPPVHYGIPPSAPAPQESGAIERRSPAQSSGRDNDTPRIYAPRPEQSRPPREDRPSGGWVRSPGVAVPRSPGPAAEGAPPPPQVQPSGESGEAKGGAVRRRPQ